MSACGFFLNMTEDVLECYLHVQFSLSENKIRYNLIGFHFSIKVRAYMQNIDTKSLRLRCFLITNGGFLTTYLIILCLKFCDDIT
jgi:hypothetical protein